jgi:YggT family protein
LSPAVAYALIKVLDVFTWVLIARVLLSWFVRDPANPVMRVLRTLVDPILAPLSRFLTFGGIDFAPLLVLLLVQLAQQALARAAALT